MPTDKTEKRLSLSAAGAAGLGGLIYGLSAYLDKGSKGLREICNVNDSRGLKDFLRNAKPNARVAVSGQVWSDEPIANTIDGQKSIATKVVHAEMISTRTDSGIRPGERLISSARKAAPMFLRWSDCKLHLLPRDLKDLEPVLEHAGTLSKDPKFHPLRSIIEGYANNSFVVRQEEREYILPLGTQITAIGQVQSRGRDYAMEPHQGHIDFSRFNLQQQMEKLDWWSSGLRTVAVGCLLVSSAFVGGLLTYRAFKALKRRQERRKEKEFLKAAEASREARRAARSGQRAEESPSSTDRSWHCIVCWNEGEGVSQAVFPACGHVAVCEECSYHLTQCPVCRTKSNPRRLYYS